MPTFKRMETNAMIDPTSMMQAPGIPPNDMTPYAPSSLYITQELYVPATDMTWAAYQMGIIAPFSLVNHPNLKYGSDATYTVTYSYFAMDGTVTTGTSEPTTSKLVDMGSLALTLGSAVIATALLAF